LCDYGVHVGPLSVGEGEGTRVAAKGKRDGEQEEDRVCEYEEL
jgi:hypothetical protein